MNMQADEAGRNRGCRDDNSFGFPPNIGAMNYKFVCGRNSDDLSSEFREGIPLPYASTAITTTTTTTTTSSIENGVGLDTLEAMLHGYGCPPSKWVSNNVGRSRLSNESSGASSYSFRDDHGSSSSSRRRSLSLAMQEILAEIACYALENIDNFAYSSSRPGIGFQVDRMSANNNKNNKDYLVALLQTVDEQYNQWLDEIHTVTSAFHAVTELDPNLHMRFALPTLSLMYNKLRERISSHILHHKELENKSLEACFIQKQWALQQLSKRENQLWRPQRGLPETSVAVLRTWMFQNFLHPYPKDSEKHLLALKSGLTRNQVSNWFINARVRLWKPMIEEMCAEMNRNKGGRRDEEKEHNHRNRMHALSNEKLYKRLT